MRTRKNLSLMLVVVALAACAPADPPVADFSITPQSIELSYPHFVSVQLAWTIKGTLEGAAGDPRVFLHLIDQDGDVVRTFDHDFPRPFKPGAEVVYSIPLSESALVPALADGQYALTVGLYDADDNRWPLAVAGEEVSPLEYRVATVTSVSTGESPKFFFSPAWLPVEGGTDLQVLARRWLGDDGVLRLSEIPGPGSLRLGIGIPSADGPQELVLGEGAEMPSVRIETTCSEYVTEVTGSGSHFIEAPVSGVGDEATCDVSFSTNYYLLSRDNMSRRTLALEALSWSPES